MIRKSITPQDAVDFLNKLLEVDPEGTHRLVFTNIDVNRAMLSKTDVKGAAPKRGGGDNFTTNVLGVINGLFGQDLEHWPSIAMEAKEIPDPEAKGKDAHKRTIIQIQRFALVDDDHKKRAGSREQRRKT